MDRFAEFQELVDALRAEEAPEAEHPARPLLPETDRDARRAFQDAVSKIGRSIHATSLKLKQMSELAKRKGTFRDPGTRVNQLTLSIKDDISNLNSECDSLDAWLAGRAEAQKKKRQSDVHARNVLGTLRTQLMATTMTFRDALRTRSDAIKAQDDRRKAFSKKSMLGRPVSVRAPAPTGGSAMGGSGGAGPGRGFGRADTAGVHARVPRPPGVDGGDGGAGDGVEEVFSPLSAEAFAPQRQYLDERARAAEEIEFHLSELGSVFTKLMGMVQRGGEQLSRIEDDLEMATTNVDAGVSQLRRAYDAAHSNWRLAMKIFFILLVFAILFFLFIA